MILTSRKEGTNCTYHQRKKEEEGTNFITQEYVFTTAVSKGKDLRNKLIQTCKFIIKDQKSIVYIVNQPCSFLTMIGCVRVCLCHILSCNLKIAVQ